MVPGLATRTRQRRGCCHAGLYLSYDRDAVCGTLYVTVPITWLRISSTRSEWSQSLVLVASFPQGPQELVEPQEPVEPEVTVFPPQARVARPEAEAHVHLASAADARSAGAVDVGYVRPGCAHYAHLVDAADAHPVDVVSFPH